MGLTRADFLSAILVYMFPNCSTLWVPRIDPSCLANCCDCRAGLGETCSHVASMLWAIKSGIRLRDSMTVTQKNAYWVIPNNIKEVPYAPVKKIHFTGKKKSQSMMSTSSSTSLHVLYKSKLLWFVLWTEKDMHIERISPDKEFWHQKVSQVQHFLQCHPELMGKFYSRTMSDHNQSTAPREQICHPHHLLQKLPKIIVIAMDLRKAIW